MKTCCFEVINNQTYGKDNIFLYFSKIINSESYPSKYLLYSLFLFYKGELIFLSHLICFNFENRMNNQRTMLHLSNENLIKKN